MKRIISSLFILLLVLIAPNAAATPTQPSALSPQHLIVSPSGPYTTLVAALADAEAGDTIDRKSVV